MLHLNEEKQKFFYKVKIGEVTGIEKLLKENKLDEAQNLFVVHISKKSGILSIMETKKEKGEAQTQPKPCKDGKIEFNQELTFGCTLFKEKKKQTFTPKLFNIILEAIDQKTNKKKEIQKVEWNISNYADESGDEKSSEDKIKLKNGIIGMTITSINDEKGGDSEDEDDPKNKRRSRKVSEKELPRMDSLSKIERKDSLNKIEKRESQKDPGEFLEIKNENLNLKIQVDNLKKEKEELNVTINQKSTQYEEKIRSLENHMLSSSSEFNQKIESLEKELEEEKKKEKQGDGADSELLLKINSLKNELDFANHSNEGLKEEVEALEKTNQSLLEKHSNESSEMSQKNQELEKLLKENESKYNEKIGLVQVEISQEKVLNSKLKDEIEDLKKKNKELQEKHQEQNSESKDSSQKVQELELLLITNEKKFNEKIEALQMEKDKEISENLSKESELKAKISILEDEVASVNKLKIQVDVLQNTVAQLNSLIEQQKMNEIKIMASIEKSKASIHDGEMELERLKQELKRVEEELENSNTLKDHLKENIQNLENEVSDKNKEIEKLNERIVESEGGSKDVQDILKKKNSEIDESNKKVLVLEREVKSLTELNIILKESITEKEQKESNSHIIALELDNLKKTHKEEVQKLKNENENLNHEITEMNNKIQKKSEEMEFNVLNMKEEMKALSISLESQSSSSAAVLNEKDKKLKDCMLQLDDLQANSHLQNSKIQELESINSELNNQLYKMEESLSKLELVNESYKEAIEDLENKLKTNEQRIIMLSSGNNALEEMKQSYESQQQDLLKENEKMKAKNAELKDKIKEEQKHNKEEKEALEKEVQKYQNQIIEKELKQKSKEEQFNKIKNENDGLKKENNTLIEKMQKILDESKNTLETLQDKMSQLKKESNQRFIIDHSILLGYNESQDNLSSKIIYLSVKHYKFEKKFLLDIVNAYYELTDKSQNDLNQIIFWLQNITILFNMLKNEDSYKDSLKELSKINVNQVQFKRNNSFEVNETTFLKDIYKVLQQFYILFLRNILSKMEQSKFNNSSILQIWTDSYNHLKNTSLDIELINHLFATSAAQLDQTFLTKFYKEKSTTQKCINLKMNVSQLERWFIERKIYSISLPFFTLSKQAVDVCTLSLKKEVLTDESMKEAVCPNLSKTQICKVLQNYEFDDLKENELKEMKELIKVGLREDSTDPEFQIEWKKKVNGDILFNSDKIFEFKGKIPEKLKNFSFLN